MHISKATMKPSLGLPRPFRTKFGRSVTAVLLGASLLLGAVAVPAAAQELPAEKLVTLVGESGGPFTRTFNPFSPTARWASTRAMYEPLMIQNFATGKLDAWLATDYKWSDDTLGLDVTLRDGVVWSDGQPLTSADVVFTFELMRKNPSLLGPASGAFDSFLKTVEAVDEKTVHFTFSTKYTPGLFSIVGQFIVPEHVWKDVADPVTFENPDPVATGPYTTIAAFSPQRYQVTRNPNYWQKIEVEGLNLQTFSGNDQIGAMVLAGQIDWGGLVPDPDVTFVPIDPEHFGYWWPRMSVVQLMVNTTNPILGDVKVRKAISLGLDRQRMINTGVWGKSVPANATGLPAGPFADWLDKAVVDAGASWIGTDPEKAKAMLDEAGYKMGPNGIRVSPDGKPLSFSIVVTSGWDDWVSACQTISENLKDIGIDVQVRTVAETAWTNSTFTGEFDMSLTSARVTATPFEFYQSNMTVASAKPIGTPSPFNQQRYSDPKADELLAAFASSADPAEQKSIIAELQAMFSEAAPLIPLYEQPDWGLYNTRRITGFPTEADPYAPLNTRQPNTTFLIFPHLAYR